MTPPTQPAEGLVIRPGDSLVVTVPDMSAADREAFLQSAEPLIKRLKDHGGLLCLIQGAEQMAVLRSPTTPDRDAIEQAVLLANPINDTDRAVDALVELFERHAGGEPR
jgi:hypothetical protein